MGKKNENLIKKSKHSKKHKYKMKINSKIKGHRNKEILNLLVRKPTTTEFINSLDIKSEILSNYKIDSSDRFEFPCNINFHEFNKLFKIGLILAKQNFSPKNLKILKILLLTLRNFNSGNDADDVFGLELCENNL